MAGRDRYSVDSERLYYSSSREDRAAVPYAHLDQYLSGSVGIDAFRGKTVLDIGAGEGIYSAWIADRGGARQVLGVELTEHRIRREYENRLANLRFVSGDMFEMSVGDGYDVVFMNLVLHHLRFRLDDVFSIVRRALAPGGVFIAFEPNVYSPLCALVHLLHSRSANEGFLSCRRVATKLRKNGFGEVRVGYFWRNRIWAKNALLGSSFWVRAIKVES